MAWRFFQSVNLHHLTLQLNSIGCKRCRPGYLNTLKDYYASHTEELCADCKVRLVRNPLRLLDCKRPACQRIADAAPRSSDHLCPECQSHFTRLQRYLSLLEIPFALNHRLVRGLDYYTRTVFEIQPENGGAQSTLVGGGRYDDLIEELGGRPTPAIGYAMGIERIILNLKEQHIPVPPLPGAQVFIAHLGDEAREEAIKLASRLRRAGTAVILATGSKSLKAQLRQANRLGARYALILGEDELKSGTASLRDMTTSQQSLIHLSELPGALK
jgi:histidyl-tRNA synthetase